MSERTPRTQRVESMAPLTPMQHGMLFHSLLDPASRAYVVQIRCTVTGALDAGALRAAWQSAVDRHGVLRTAFAWQRAEGSVQITWSRATVPWRDVDWTGVDPDAIPTMLDDLLDHDRAQGFELAKAPLIRLTLVRLAAEQHVLVWTMHHIVLDGWSVARVLDEVTAAYAARQAGRVPASVTPRPFSEFLNWHASRPREAAESYWRSALRGIEEATSPLGRVATRNGPPVPRDVTRTLSAPITTSLSTLAESSKVTLGTVVLGAWCLVLSRIAGRRDVITGVTIAGRPPELPGVEEMVGLFINTLPFRAVVDPRRTVDEWLRDLQRTSVELREHGHVSLVDVQEWSGLARTTPLFDHLFVFENYPASSAAGEAGNLTISDVRSVEPTEYGLTVVVVPGEELSIQLSYDAATVAVSDVERLADLFAIGLASMAGSAKMPLWRHSLLSSDERQRVTAEWNATRCEWRGSVIPHELFEEQTRKTPDAPAAEFDGRRVSYRDLDERANQLAHHLIAHGVGVESSVGIFMNRSLEMVVAVLATLKAGGAYVPLDPAYPADRLEFMAGDGQLAVLITEGALVARAPAGAPTTVVIDAEWSAIGRRSVTSPAVRVDGDNTLYVIYTSGSTGKPKGIVLAHGALGNLIRWHMIALPPAPNMLQFASLSFDASFHEMFAAWATGGCVHLITDDQRHDVDALLEFVASRPIDRVILPVVVLQRWAAEHGEDLSLFANLREIITTGEQLQITQPIVALMRRLPSATLHNHYGPAETHVITSHSLGPDHDAWPTYPPVGVPVANSEVYVLDEWLMPVPVGVSGELYLGGANLARGYLGRPDLTAAKFVPHPYGRAGSRLYKTGDQARWLTDGTVEYLGRLDLMVKIRGNRVELGEIEGALGEHPSVGSCAVAVFERAAGDKRIMAYCVPADNAVIDAPLLRAHLATSLPDYMLPSSFVELSELPLTPNGKIDRRSLPAPDNVRTGPAHVVRPRDLVEEVISRAWSEVLGIERVGARDNFFELGGHSLTAVQMLARVRNAFGVVPPLRALFDHPVLESFAASVRETMGAPVTPRAPIEPRSESHSAPLSPAQERIYFLQRLDPYSSAYNLGGKIRLTGALNHPALEQALRGVVARHAILRTRFVSSDDGIAQHIDPVETFALRRIDVSALGMERALAEVDRFCRRELSRPFDLGDELPVRATSIAVSPVEHVLSLTLHHIAADGGSIEIFLRELGALYDAAVRGKASPLAPPVLQYADLATHIAMHETGDAASLEFWRKTLAGVEPLELPTDRPRPATPRFRGASVVWPLGAELTEAIEKRARSTGSTPFVICLAAFAELLRRYARTTDVAVATPVSGRDRVELEGMIGLLLNTIVLRLRTSGDPTARAVLDQTRATLLDAFAHRDVPFERVVDAVRPARDRSRAPIAQVMFDFHAWREDDVEAGGVRFALEEVGVDTTKFDLTLVLEQRSAAGGLVASLEYDTDLFDAETATRMRGHLETLLRGLTADPATRLSAVEMTTAGERERLSAWGRPVSRSAPPSTIRPLLDLAAASVPDAIAISDAQGTLTYESLGERVEDAARSLRARGVGPRVVVALCMERSRELVITLLAVLRAGGAFVPIDPASPEAHRRWIIKDSGARLVLTGIPVPVTDGSASAGDPPDTDDVAYILYTSGSTGRPKGCQISHRALASYLSWATRFYFESGQETGGSCALFSAITFDLTITSLFLPLIRGRTLTILPANLPASDLPHVAIRGGDLVKLTPSHIALLAGEAESRPELRVVIVGGEQLTLEHLRIIERIAPNAAIFNEYGPTEATVGCIVARVRSTDPRVLIGRPADHARAVVLDDGGRLAPIGVFGELHIGGPSLARGYGGRASLTAERFIPDVASQVSGARVYRTGDLARWTRDGFLECAGRSDDQVKLRGYRIEPGEIVAALETNPAVLRAAVVGDPAGPSPERLVAYLETDGAVDPVGLRAFLEPRLPAYMIPALFVRVERLPITAHGKLDRRALPAPDRAAGTDASIVLPRTEIERILVGVWKQLLRLESVGVHDNFFELGGDSILSMQVVSLAARRGVEITVDALFRHQTIAALATVAGHALRSGGTEAMETVAGPLAASPIQKWFFELGLHRPEHFNQAVMLAVSDVDRDALANALNVLRRHHDTLRLTARRVMSGEWSLNIEPDGQPIVLRHVDLAPTPAGARAAEIERIAGALQATIDLAAGPPLVAVLFSCGATEPARLLIAVHHLAVDGVSWRILLEDLETVYGALRRGETPRLPAKTCSVIDWSRSLARFAELETTREALSFWQQMDAGSPLPYDGPGRSGTVGDERSVVVSLGAGETESLVREVRRTHDARVDDALLAGLAVACGADCPDGVRIDVESHGRARTPNGNDRSRTVGWFTAMYPLALPPATAARPDELLATIKERSRAAVDRALEYGVLKYSHPDAAVRASLRAAGPAQVLFNYHGNLDAALVAGGAFSVAPEQPGPEKDPGGRRSHAIEITAAIVDARLEVTWTFSESQFREARIASMANEQMAILRVLSSQPASAHASAHASALPEAGEHTLSDSELSALEAELLD